MDRFPGFLFLCVLCVGILRIFLIFSNALRHFLFPLISKRVILLVLERGELRCFERERWFSDEFEIYSVKWLHMKRNELFMQFERMFGVWLRWARQLGREDLSCFSRGWLSISLPMITLYFSIKRQEIRNKCLKSVGSFLAHKVN